MQHHIGSYEVLGILGDGGMGTVYKGRDPRFDRAVAIKVLHPQFQRDPEIVERFKSEALIQAKLNHPNIVTVFDFIATDDTLAMVMEYVEGKPLDQVIDECHGPMDPARVVELMRQILSAMGYAHEQGLVHRDIKPSNIAIQRVGDDEVAKVMDFGIAKILGSEKLKTATGAKMGTLAYMSPEQIKSPKNVDARSDIYSLGAVLYEMLTGQLPFEADSEYELMKRIVSGDVRLFAHTTDTISPQLQFTLERALDKAPSARFPSCADFRMALTVTSSRATVWPDLSSSLPPLPTPARLRRPWRSWGAMLGLAATACFFLCLPEAGLLLGLTPLWLLRETASTATAHVRPADWPGSSRAAASWLVAACLTWIAWPGSFCDGSAQGDPGCPTCSTAVGRLAALLLVVCLSWLLWNGVRSGRARTSFSVLVSLLLLWASVHLARAHGPYIDDRLYFSGRLAWFWRSLQREWSYFGPRLLALLCSVVIAGLLVAWATREADGHRPSGAAV